MGYSVYIVVCADGSYYTGIAVDVERRVLEHNREKGKGARYTSSRRPVEFVYQAQFPTQSDALREEARIKRLKQAEKQRLISDAADRWANDSSNAGDTAVTSISRRNK